MSKGREGPAAGAAAVLLRYLREQNRPYSAQDAFGNLQREHGLGKAVSGAGAGARRGGPGRG
uniref:Homologous-pairing protein 2 winged helix domain-containing protein n=1 Tax=Strix occidentalis caurina TaxID=311401 RepID=A0A8D0FV86_STROC